MQEIITCFLRQKLILLHPSDFFIVNLHIPILFAIRRYFNQFLFTTLPIHCMSTDKVSLLQGTKLLLVFANSLGNRRLQCSFGT